MPQASIAGLRFFFSSRRRHTSSKRDWSSRRVLFRSRSVTCKAIVVVFVCPGTLYRALYNRDLCTFPPFRRLGLNTYAVIRFSSRAESVNVLGNPRCRIRTTLSNDRSLPALLAPVLQPVAKPPEH